MKEFPRLKRGDQVELEITGSAFEGKSIARHHGLVVFVEGGVPGDLVTAQILKSKKNLVEARLVRLHRSSQFRTDPRCSHFGPCGGCKWQHVDYKGQLQFKQQHVVDSFERIGGFNNLPLQPIIPSDEVFFYRNKMEFSFSDREWLEHPADDGTVGEGPGCGIFLGLHVPQRFDKVLDLKGCYLQSEISNKILGLTREFARERKAQVYSSESDSGYLRFLVVRLSRRTQEVMVNLVTRTDDPAFMNAYTERLRGAIPDITTVVNTINTKRAQIAFGDEERIYLGEGVIREILANRTFIISAGSFFQTNTNQAEKLYDVVMRFAEFDPADVVYDLYSGTGSIALCISGCVRQVVGVESVESAVRDAERNTTANGVSNCEFVLGDLKDRLSPENGWLQKYAAPRVVILDPPRSGIHPKVAERLLELAPPKIVYVSCNPATQARDLKVLCSEKYQLAKLQPVDMFPHTYHIENVALLLPR